MNPKIQLSLFNYHTLPITPFNQIKLDKTVRNLKDELEQKK